MDPVSIVLALAQVAPSLIKWATGSDTAEKVAQVALDTAKSITGQSNLDDSIDVLKQNPEMHLAFQTAMLNRDSEFEKLYLDDKKDARARDIALAVTPRGNVRANYLVAFAVSTVTMCLTAVMFLEFKDEWAKGVIMLVLGMYISELKNIYSFEFGSTRVRQQQVDTELADLRKK